MGQFVRRFRFIKYHHMSPRFLPSPAGNGDYRMSYPVEEKNTIRYANSRLFNIRIFIGSFHCSLISYWRRKSILDTGARVANFISETFIDYYHWFNESADTLLV